MEENNLWEKNYEQGCAALQGSYDVIVPTEILEVEQANDGLNLTPGSRLKKLNGQNGPLKENRCSEDVRVKPPSLRSTPSTETLRSLPTVSLISDKDIYLAPEGAVGGDFSQKSGIRKIRRRQLAGESLTEDSISITDLRELNRFSLQLSHKLTTHANKETINCQLYSKCTQPMRNQKLLYATNQHGSVYTGYQKGLSQCENEWKKLNEPRTVVNNREGIFTRVKEETVPKTTCIQYRPNHMVSKPRGLPHLPKRMSSEDYIRSWLVRGSVPQGLSHFPNIN